MKKALLFILIILATNSFGQNLESGLVAYYPFNGNANDESGNGNNGNLINVISSTDSKNRSESTFSFNGTNSKIAINNINISSSQFVVSFYCYINNFKNEGMRLIDKVEAGKDNGFLIDLYPYNNLRFCGAGNCYNSNIKLNAQNWYYITVKFDNGNLSFYLNGKLISNISTQKRNVSTNSFPLLIGSPQGSLSGNQFLNGKIDDIRIYNRALSDSEVRELYNLDDSNSTPNNPQVVSKVNIYETVKKIDCYTQIKPEIFTFDNNLAMIKISENTFSVIGTNDLQEKTKLNYKEEGIIKLENSYSEGNSIYLAVSNKKGEIDKYVKYNLFNFSTENIKCKTAPRGCITSSASSNYVSPRNNTPYDFGGFKIFFRSNGSQYYYEISKVVTEKNDFNNAMNGSRNDKLDFLKKYPNSEYKSEVTTAVINSFTKIKDISDFIKTNNNFNTELDARAFELVKKSSLIDKVNEYLSVFPNGKFVTNANKKIAEIKLAKTEEEKLERQRIANEQIAQQQREKEEKERQAEAERQRKIAEENKRQVLENRRKLINGIDKGDVICYSEDWQHSEFFGLWRENYKMVATMIVDDVTSGGKIILTVNNITSSSRDNYASMKYGRLEIKENQKISITKEDMVHNNAFQFCQ